MGVLMSADIRPAMPGILPHVVPFRAGRDRLVRGLATTVTVLTAIAAVTLVSFAAVMLALN
jgi:hypothetical protein